MASGEGGGGALGGAKINQKIMAPPLSVIKIVKYCGVVGRGGGEALGALKSYKNNGAPFSVIKIVKYCRVWGGGGAFGSAKILQKIMAPPLFVIKIRIVALGEDDGGGGWHWGAPKSIKR